MNAYHIECTIKQKGGRRATLLWRSAPAITTKLLTISPRHAITDCQGRGGPTITSLTRHCLPPCFVKESKGEGGSFIGGFPLGIAGGGKGKMRGEEIGRRGYAIGYPIVLCNEMLRECVPAFYAFHAKKEERIKVLSLHPLYFHYSDPSAKTNAPFTNILSGFIAPG